MEQRARLYSIMRLCKHCGWYGNYPKNNMNPLDQLPVQGTLLPAPSFIPGTSGELMLKQPQSLIHISHTITPVQYCIWLLICSAFQKHFEADKERILNALDPWVTVSRTDITNLFGYDPGFQNLRDDLYALRHADLNLNLLEKDGRKKGEHLAGFISEANVYNSRIEVCLPSHVREAIVTNSERFFSMINWHVFRGFSQKYESIIYKLCNDYRGCGRTKVFSVEEWRHYCNIHEPDPVTGKLPFSMAADLIRHTLTAPVRNVNATPNCDIEVILHETRRAKKLISFQFEVREKRTTPTFIPEEAFALAQVPLSKNVKKRAAEEMPPEQIALSIDRANAYIGTLEAKGAPVTKGAIYNYALKHNWGREQQEAQQAQAAEQAALEEAAKAKRKLVRDERLEALRAEYKVQRLRERLRAFEADAFLLLAEQFMDETGGAFTPASFNIETRRFKAIELQLQFRSWLALNFTDEVKEDEFKQWLKERETV